jgi:hypothetical protein
MTEENVKNVKYVKSIKKMRNGFHRRVICTESSIIFLLYLTLFAVTMPIEIAASALNV